MKKDGLTLGWGMAACSWIAERVDAEATVVLKSDGTARISCATQDIGTGTYTILAQIVGEKTGLPLEKIDVLLGDTALPPGPISGGSWATASVIPAVSQAAQNAMQAVLTAATKEKKSPFAGQQTDALQFEEGRVYLKTRGRETGVAFQDILKQSNINAASGRGKSRGTFRSKEPRKYSTHSFGAHFAEVTWQPEIARLRVSRVVTVIDAGRIMNSRPARNQIEGSVVMGVGMAFFEKTKYDQRNGAPINSNLADYVVATHADAPEIDVTFLDYPDLVLNEFGARGVGEIGHAGIAAALTSAVYHASGFRVRELPVRIEDLLVQT
jgi:xanthine dehydrogenase YagR molybdenum-binding subunit